jgi:hypothetical protein
VYEFGFDAVFDGTCTQADLFGFFKKTYLKE